MMLRGCLTASLALLLLPAATGAETIRLAEGGRLKGEILEERSTPETLAVRTLSGILVGVPRDQVVAVAPLSEAEQEYLRRRSETPDTAEDLLALARWCRQQRLREHRSALLREILRRDSGHAEARRLLGYRYRDGRWMTTAQWRLSEGHVRHKGRWRLPQQVDLLEERAAQKEIAGQWYRNVRLWHGWVRDDIRRRASGISKLQAIRDPAALAALERFLADDPSPDIRLLCVDVVAGVPGGGAVKSLVVRALLDASSDVRFAAVEKLVQRKNPLALTLLARSLHHANNRIVRRAAEAMGEFRDPAAIEPLIGALVTQHRVAVASRQPSGFGSTRLELPEAEAGRADPASAGPFLPVMAQQGTVFTPGGQGPTEIAVSVENHEALYALNKLTGKNFQFDQTAWRHWWERYLETRGTTMLERP